MPVPGTRTGAFAVTLEKNRLALDPNTGMSSTMVYQKKTGNPVYCRKRCHPHMLRDTFAVELLLAGVPLERVSVLLGHQSVKVTEKHYTPWVRARQEQLESDVRRTWNTDLVAAGETKGTPEVHSGSERPN